MPSRARCLPSWRLCALTALVSTQHGCWHINCAQDAEPQGGKGGWEGWGKEAGGFLHCEKPKSIN